jgi:type II secretory pathway pseudopilin PulG
VIAIIAILAAILFPVFAQAKEAAKKTSCLSNFNGMGKAFHLYMADWDDTYPMVNRLPCSAVNCTGTNPNQTSWVLDIQPYVANIRYCRCPADPNATDIGLDLDPVTGVRTTTQQARLFAWATRANHGLNSQYLSPMYRWSTTQFNGSIDAFRPIKFSMVGAAAETILIIDSIWDRAATTGAPLDGGNWALDPPCRFYAPGGAGNDSFPITTGVIGVWWFGGWNPTGSQTAWNIFGGVFPFHLANKAAGQQTWNRRNDGIVCMSFCDGHSKAMRIDAIAAGCDVRNAWGGFIFDRDRYLWDLQ